MRLTPLLLTCIALTIAHAQKQTIDSAEYFIGRDPGEGLGMHLRIQSGDATAQIDWQNSGIPLISSKDLVYVRVKSSGFIDVNGNPVRGMWSLPVGIKLPSTKYHGGSYIGTAAVMNAEIRIFRPGLGYPLKKLVVPSDGAFDQVVEQLRVRLPVDSLQDGDTLMVRLQGKDEVWGEWKQFAVRREHLRLAKPYNLNVTKTSSNIPSAHLDWECTTSGSLGFAIERRRSTDSWTEVARVSVNNTNYTDSIGLLLGENYCWRVRSVGITTVMTSEPSEERCLTILQSNTPEPAFALALAQNHPNPFPYTTTLPFLLDASDRVTLTVHDALGREITRLLANEQRSPGHHAVTFDGSALPPGVYTYRLATPAGVLSKTMVITR
ncbi:MAG: T9SS type A sorting domain-containing protein [Ignavibacteriae bacterium]|nr:T9SS type A sorting domain-containing protein [Ignavibacteriota bacterium]